MYKSIPTGLKKMPLDRNLFDLHKNAAAGSDFGMDSTAELLEGNFGLYSSKGVKKRIGPAKTQYFRISLTRSGSADFSIGLENYRPQRNWILFGIPGQVFSLHDFSDDFLAYYMLFTDAFMLDGLQSLQKHQPFPFLTYTGLQCFELQEDTATEIEGIIFKINQEIKRNQPACSNMIRLYLQQILILANRNYGDRMVETMGRSNSLQGLFHNYLKLVGQHFLTVRKVSDYAAMLHVSADHLNRAIKACSDKTASAFIDDMMLMEAKAYLLHSGMTIAEIAYHLEFSDPSHFNRFFRKLEGCTPLEFRSKS